MMHKPQTNKTEEQKGNILFFLLLSLLWRLSDMIETDEAALCSLLNEFFFNGSPHHHVLVLAGTLWAKQATNNNSKNHYWYVTCNATSIWSNTANTTRIGIVKSFVVLATIRGKISKDGSFWSEWMWFVMISISLKCFTEARLSSLFHFFILIKSDPCQMW